MGSFFGSGWSSPSSSFVLVWLLCWNLSTMGDPAGIWNPGGTAFSITAACSCHSMTINGLVVWFPDLGNEPRPQLWERGIITTRPSGLANLREKSAAVKTGYTSCKSFTWYLWHFSVIIVSSTFPNVTQLGKGKARGYGYSKSSLKAASGSDAPHSQHFLIGVILLIQLHVSPFSDWSPQLTKTLSPRPVMFSSDSTGAGLPSSLPVVLVSSPQVTLMLTSRWQLLSGQSPHPHRAEAVTIVEVFFYHVVSPINFPVSHFLNHCTDVGQEKIYPHSEQVFKHSNRDHDFFLWIIYIFLWFVVFISYLIILSITFWIFAQIPPGHELNDNINSNS